MNRFIYPQGPSPANVKLKRLDEASDPTDVRVFDTEQEKALIGETIPLVFCKREVYKQDADGKDVERGGVWVAPRIIALGLKDNVFSLLYVLTQGQIVTLDKKDVKYGAEDITSFKDENDAETVHHCLDYEKIPACAEIDYNPGGNLGWTNTIITNGPSLRIDQSEEQLATWRSATSKCTGISMNLAGVLTVSGSGSYTEPVVHNIWDPSTSTSREYSMIVSLSYGTGTYGHLVDNSLSEPYQLYHNTMAKSSHMDELTNGEIQPSYSTAQYGKVFDQSAPFSRNIQWTAYSYRTWSYRVVNDDTGAVVRTGSVKFNGKAGSAVVTEDGLPAARYRVEFYATTALRSGGPQVRKYSAASSITSFHVTIDASYACSAATAALEYQNQIISTYNGQLFEDIRGSESAQVSVAEVVEKVYIEIEFPDDPNGSVGTAGEFTDLTLVGLTGPAATLSPPSNNARFKQINCFCREGIQVKRHMHSMTAGASNNFVDLVLYLLESTQRVRTEQIDHEALLFAARFTQTLGLHFDGAITQTKSFEEWITKTAPFFLLSIRQRDGLLGLAPVLPIDAQYQIDLSPVVPKKVFTLDDIVQGTYSRSYINADDRAPVCLIMVFREQLEGAPEHYRSIEVRYPGSAIAGPFETHDMTEFCISVDHAGLVGRYILAQRRYVTHTASVTVGREAALLVPGDIIQLKLDVDTADGEKAITSNYLYEVDSISEAPTGEIELELIHFPVDAAGVSVLAKEATAGGVEVS